MLKYSKIQDQLNNDLKGREFVYKSKYGSETFGIIDRIIVRQDILRDAASKKRHEIALYLKGFLSRIETHEIPEVPRKFVASRPEIIIVSTKNISYNMYEDNIYIIHEEN